MLSEILLTRLTGISIISFLFFAEGVTASWESLGVILAFILAIVALQTIFLRQTIRNAILEHDKELGNRFLSKEAEGLIREGCAVRFTVIEDKLEALKGEVK